MSTLVYSPNGVFTEQREGGRQAKGHSRRIFKADLCRVAEKTKKQFLHLSPPPPPTPSPRGAGSLHENSPPSPPPITLSCYFMFILLLRGG